MPDAGRLGSRLLWYNRRRTFAKIEAMLRGRAGPPLAERLHEVPASACLTPTSRSSRWCTGCRRRRSSTASRTCATLSRRPPRRPRRLRRRGLPARSTSSRAPGCTSTSPAPPSELVGLDLDEAGVDDARAARVRGVRGRLPRRRRRPRARDRARRRRRRRRGDRAPRRPGSVPRRPARAGRARRAARRHHAERRRARERGGAARQLRGEPPRPRRPVHLHDPRHHAPAPRLGAGRARGVPAAGEVERRPTPAAASSPPARARCSGWSDSSPGSAVRTPPTV